MMENEEMRISPVMDAMEEFHMAGHSFVDAATLLSRCRMGREVAASELEALAVDDLLHVEDTRVYTERVYSAEKRAAESLALRLDSNYRPWEGDYAGMNPFGYSLEQQSAIRMALDHGLSLILGGAGTGKTTVVSGLVEVVCDSPQKKVLLLAPTGRAAANIQEATLFKAYTIHSALQDAAKWENVQLVVIDEASMLTVELLDRVLARCPANCRIVLVGDPNQLLAVGPGNVIHDLLISGFSSVTLLENHRQTDEQSALRQNVMDFRHIANSAQLQFDDTFRFVETPDWNVANIVINEAAERYRKEEWVQVLSPVNEVGPTSVDALNRELHPNVNPYTQNAPYLSNSKECFWEGDRVLVTQNLKEAGLYNGNVGILHLYPQERRDAVAAIELGFGSRKYLNNLEQLEHLQHGYAMTVHKAQGSSFDTVIIPVTRGMRYMLTRNLLYTAITRARVQVILVGSRSALDYALRTAAPERNSTLQIMTWRARA